MIRRSSLPRRSSPKTEGSKVRRPGNGPVPRGATQAKREAAAVRRLYVERFGTPLEKAALRIPYTGSRDFLVRFWGRTGLGGVCWEWTGKRDDRPDQGYGMVTLANAGFRAHRIAWELANGQELPTEVFACHSCDNPPCCNPAHLFPGTVTDNNQDSVRKGRNANACKTHCKRGHPLTPDNLSPMKNGGRRCRACAKRLAMKNYYKRQGNPEMAAAWAP